MGENCNPNNNTIQSANKIVYQIESRVVKQAFKCIVIFVVIHLEEMYVKCNVIKMSYNLFRNPLMYIFNILRVKLHTHALTLSNAFMEN